MLYQIQATSTVIDKDGWEVTRQLPTFYLHGDIQGIVDDLHAEQIAFDILQNDNNKISVVVTKLVPLFD